MAEETKRVIERRILTMRALASELAAVDTRIDVIRASHRALKDNLQDLPFSALYLFQRKW